MNIQITAAFVVLILGIIGIIVAATRESLTSQFWFNCAFWVTALTLLGGVYFRA